MKNKLVIIGWMGIKTAYLNMSKEDAIKRYLIDEPDCESFDMPGFVECFEFDDEFGVYDAWAGE